MARELHEVDKLGAFFDIIHQDPVLSQVKLIAEPWDLGEGGYQVGNFPALWSEWNGKYRDSVRRFWKGDGGMVSEFATRISGSSDLYEWSGRRPHASINFITCHDGFTLNDLVSYDQKHNEANGEDNRDGANDNDSWNCGVEGPTDDPKIIELREKKKRAFLATLIFSQGIPMLLAGDEICHTQRGNNNAYCQDNEITWLNWKLDDRQKKMLDFVRRLIAIYDEEPTFHRRKFFHGKSLHGDSPEIAWLDPSGKEMSADAWKAGHVRCLGVHMFGGHIDVDEYGTPIIGDHLLILFNADHATDIPFVLPEVKDAEPWERLLDTALESMDIDKPAQKGADMPKGRALCGDFLLDGHLPSRHSEGPGNEYQPLAGTAGTTIAPTQLRSGGRGSRRAAFVHRVRTQENCYMPANIPTDRTNNWLKWGAVAGGAYLAAKAAVAYSRRYDFRNRVVVITGGSRGLGLVLARRLADEGAFLVLCARDVSELDEALEDLRTRTEFVEAYACDLTKPVEIGELFQRIRREIGSVDVLINNAGVIQVGPVDTMTLDDFHNAMLTHFSAPLLCMWQVLPDMHRRREGRIVNISSIGGQIGIPHMAPYCASKFALNGMSQTFQAELVKDGIYVTTVCPGLMRTGSPRNALFKGDHRAGIRLVQHRRWHAAAHHRR